MSGREKDRRDRARVEGSMEETIRWAASVGTAGMVLAFIAIVTWRILFGTAKSAGLLDRWEERRNKHELEQTAQVQDDRTAVIKAAERAASLLVLTNAQEPPEGAAWIAQEQVAITAEKVDQIYFGMIQFTKALRLIGTQFPDVNAGISGYCDEIEAKLEAAVADIKKDHRGKASK